MVVSLNRAQVPSEKRIFVKTIGQKQIPEETVGFNEAKTKCLSADAKTNEHSDATGEILNQHHKDITLLEPTLVKKVKCGYRFIL